jgi:RNA polymerase sigma-70 factor (sigma-E family)
VAHGEFREFVEMRYAELLRTAYLLTGSQPAAEDMVQSCLLRAMRRWRDIDDPMAYLRRSMANHRISVWRRLRRGEVLSDSVPDRPTADTTSAVAERDELLAALATLPRSMRAVLVLRYWEDMSEADTAAALGCSVGAVKSTASRGLARLRGVLPPRGASEESVDMVRGSRS